MSLNPRAIALQGIGSTPRAVAVQGLVAVQGPGPTPGTGAFTNRPWRDVPYLPVLPKRSRKKRQEEIVLLS